MVSVNPGYAEREIEKWWIYVPDAPTYGSNVPSTYHAFYHSNMPDDRIEMNYH